jgi:NAD(P)-dependent dehydrogenase (short-subunit alcohol dehydrogenase family)
VAFVTGAASGIGAAIAAELSGSGWRTASFDLHEASTDRSYVGDVTDLDVVAAAVTAAVEELGPLEALVTAAGHYEMIPIAEISDEQWQRMLHVHLGGLANAARAALPGMTAGRQGSIVAVSSELAIGGGDGDAHYAAAKGAIVGLIRSLALECAPFGVGVNSVAPGPTDTPLLPPDSPWRAPDYLATLPAGQLARPEEIARVVRFVLEEGSFLVGEVISVNSGAVI